MRKDNALKSLDELLLTARECARYKWDGYNLEYNLRAMDEEAETVREFIKNPEIKLDNDISCAIPMLQAMRSAEQIMRDDRRREGNAEISQLHGDRAQMLSEVIDALKSAPPRPAVRPLVWEYNENLREWTARTPFWTYVVDQWKWGLQRDSLQKGIYTTSYYKGGVFGVGEEEKGKAAAETHWQSKIGECLG